MQLDQTHVAVRVRTLSEMGDLALVLVRQYPSTILTGFLIGAWPWMVANGLLIYWIPLTEAQFGLDDPEALNQILRYAAWMVLLVFLQAPAAGVITTVYLGQAVFEQKPSWKGAAEIVKTHFWRWFWCLGVMRLAIPAMILVGFRMFQPVNGFFDVVVPGAFLLWAVIVRAGRPFLPEMILLERCPIRSSDPNEITLSRRSRALHRPVGSDVGSRWFAAATTFSVLWAGLFYSFVWAHGIATGYWNLGLFTLLFLFPLALWIIAGVSIVVRMIHYLDTRIRLEGWDVELAIKAEAIRQFGTEIVYDQNPKTPRPDAS